MPQKTEVRRIHASANEHVEVFMDDVLQLQHRSVLLMSYSITGAVLA